MSCLKRAWMACALCAATALALQAQTFTTLHSFDSTDGSLPTAALVQATDGNFYGTTLTGGVANYGTVFKITPSGTFTALYSFCSQSNCPDGQNPGAPLIQATDGNLYGTTSGGGALPGCPQCGTVFKITLGGTLTTLASFCTQIGCSDSEPNGLVQATDGNFYGTTFYGGNGAGPCALGHTCGTVFEVTPSGTLTTLYNLDSTGGSNPEAALVQGSDGNFYGTTYAGGTGDCSPFFGCGTVFEITPSGTFTTLHNFEETDGSNPEAALIQAADGNFYGTTFTGGFANSGTVFEITPSGTLTTLYGGFCPLSDCTNGAGPSAALIQGTDGNFYGTTSYGGTTGYGTLFEIAPSGTLTTLYNFCSQSGCADGANPESALVQDASGTFYGTTAQGGTSTACPGGCGTVFSLSPSPIASLSPASLAFSSQLIGTISPVQVVTLTNTGNATLTFTAGSVLAGADAGDFLYCASMAVPGAKCMYAGITEDCGVTMSLYPGGTCTVGLAFDPTAAGTRTATLSFNDDAAGSPQVVTITGTGSAPAPAVLLSPASLSFAAQEVGTASPIKKVTLTNTGTAALSITSVAASGDFSLISLCKGSIAVGASCSISVIFEPKAAGALSGTLTVTDNAAGSPQSVPLTGTGTEPAVTLAPASLSFGAELAGQSSVATAVTLTNTGGAPLAVSSISFTGADAGDFSQQNNCGSSVAAGATCTINVTFKPAAGGSRSATLNVTDNAPASPQTVALTGTGSDFTLAVASGSSASATVSAGQSASYKLSAGPMGNFSGSVSLACTGAPMAASCEIAAPAVSVGPGMISQPIIVTVSTTARSGAAPRWPKLPPLHRWPISLWWLIGFTSLAALAMLVRLRAAGRHHRAAGRNHRVALARARPALILALILVLAGIVVAIPGCGGGMTTMTNQTGTPAGTYMLTVTGTYTSGSVTLQHNVSLTLTVQ